MNRRCPSLCLHQILCFFHVILLYFQLLELLPHYISGLVCARAFERIAGIVRIPTGLLCHARECGYMSLMINCHLIVVPLSIYKSAVLVRLLFFDGHVAPDFAKACTKLAEWKVWTRFFQLRPFFFAENHVRIRGPFRSIWISLLLAHFTTICSCFGSFNRKLHDDTTFGTLNCRCRRRMGNKNAAADTVHVCDRQTLEIHGVLTFGTLYEGCILRMKKLRLAGVTRQRVISFTS